MEKGEFLGPAPGISESVSEIVELWTSEAEGSLKFGIIGGTKAAFITSVAFQDTS